MTRIGAIDADRLRGHLESIGFSGVVHVSGAPDEPVIEVALGLADRAAGIPNTPETRFGVASVSKLVTGMTVARLVDVGALAWDARYVDLVPAELRPTGLDERVTLQHLLTHTAGLDDYFDEDGDEDYGEIWRRTPGTLIRGPRDMWPLLVDLRQVAEPGTVARYNNGAFILVGIALEHVTGKPFPEIVRYALFEPLAMADSGFWALDDIVPRLAVGYVPPEDDAGPGTPNARWRTNVYAIPAMGGPDGGVQSTVGDLARLLDGLMGWESGSPFLTPATRAHLIGPHARDEFGAVRVRVRRAPRRRRGRVSANGPHRRRPGCERQGLGVSQRGARDRRVERHGWSGAAFVAPRRAARRRLTSPPGGVLCYL